jgi:hypothetical protein
MWHQLIFLPEGIVVVPIRIYLSGGLLPEAATAAVPRRHEAAQAHPTHQVLFILTVNKNTKYT